MSSFSCFEFSSLNSKFRIEQNFREFSTEKNFNFLTNLFQSENSAKFQSNREFSSQLAHPVVLVHGLLGFDSFLSFEYFHGVREFFESRGVRVISPRLPAAAPIEVRARALFDALEIEKLNSTNSESRFHLIGHSMGGLDSRFLISKLQSENENRIASLTTLASPHHGAKMADLILNEANNLDLNEEKSEKILNNSSKSTSEIKNFQFPALKISNFLEKLNELVGLDFTGLGNLTTEFMEKFNEEVPMRAGTKYFSYGGECSSVWSHYYIQAKYLKKFEGPNDGLVSVESSKYGKYLKTLPLDHTQFIGMFAGGRHLELYEEILKNLHEIENEEKRERNFFNESYPQVKNENSKEKEDEKILEEIEGKNPPEKGNSVIDSISQNNKQ